jgi:hypothetical protein
MTKAVKDSKAQILQTFHQLLADYKARGTRVATRQEEADKESGQQILEAASAYTINTIVRGLADLQLDFNSIVTNLSDKLTAETTKLDELRQAIEIETQRLQELQQFRVVADALHILRQEHQARLAVLAQDATQQQEAFNKVVTTTRKAWEQEQVEFEARGQEQRQFLELSRLQELEDYQYQLEQDRKLEADQYAEERRDLEREIQETTLEKDKHFTERELKLTQTQKQFADYQKRIETMPTELEEAIKKSREEGIREANQDAKVKADLLEKEWEASKRGHEFKVQALDVETQKKAQQIESLAQQLQSALQQAQDLAMRAFASNPTE